MAQTKYGPVKIWPSQNWASSQTLAQPKSGKIWISQKWASHNVRKILAAGPVLGFSPTLFKSKIFSSMVVRRFRFKKDICGKIRNRTNDEFFNKFRSYNFLILMSLVFCLLTRLKPCIFCHFLYMGCTYSNITY